MRNGRGACVLVGSAAAALLATGCVSGTRFLPKVPVIENGVSQAEIVVARERPRMATLAALELQHYLGKIGGARLPIVTDPTEGRPVKLYVGRSEHTDRLGVSDEGLKYGAFKIVSGPDYLVLLGHDFDFVPLQPWPTRRSDMARAQAEWDKLVGDRTDSAWGYPFASGFKGHWQRYTQSLKERFGEEGETWWPAKDFTSGFWVSDSGGSLNAVYEFLRVLGARWYMPGELGEVLPELSSVLVPPSNRTVRPDFAVRAYTWYNYAGFPFEDAIWARRMGMNSAYEVLGNMGYAHGLSQVHARKEMQEAHPDYYALVRGKRVTDYRGRGHACFSSGGFFQEVIKFARFVFDEHNQPHISLWPMDGFQHCQCEGCQGIPSSELVWGFVDRVARELYRTHPDRLVSCGAYTPYIHPPKTVEKFTPNVVVFISNCGRPLMDDPVRWNSYWQRVEGWRKKVAPGNIMRVENNRYGLARQFPVMHPRNMAKDLHALKGISRGECCEEAQKQMRWHSPGLDHLTLYVQSRFLWDADSDVEALLHEYYALFYGPAQNEMKTVIEFAEASYSRTDTSRNGGRCNPRNVPLTDRVRLGALLAAAGKKAGDTVYGRRIQVMIDELPPLDQLRKQMEEEVAAGNPRTNAPVVVAHSVSSTNVLQTYRLEDDIRSPRKPPLKTAFSVSWDKAELIFDVRCYETNMSSIRVSEKVWDGDSVAILLESPTHSYYHIEISPDGKVFDADRAGGGRVTERWESMTTVETDRGTNYWRVTARVPIAIAGKEGAEGDPMNYVVGPEPGPGDGWYLNVGRTRPREGERRPAAYAFARPGRYTLHSPDGFARVEMER